MRRAAGALAVLAALVLAGCGGSGGSGTTTAAGPPGRQLFVDLGCGTCHTLAAAGGEGRVGTNLDGAVVDVPVAEQVLRDGKGTMPSYADRLNPAQVTELARYLASASRAAG